MVGAVPRGLMSKARSEGASNCANQKDVGDGFDSDALNIIAVLRACAIQKDLVKGSKLHVQIRKHKLLEKNSFIANTLISMYARCGAVAVAKQVLDELLVRDVVTWTALIAGFSQQGQGIEALRCFDSMMQEGHIPDAFAFACALKACGVLGAVAKGKQIYDKVVSLGILRREVVLGNALVDMFVKCGELVQAQQVLKELPVRNAVTWNALIAGYAQYGQGEEALRCFDGMQQDGHFPDVITFICALKACGYIAAAAKGKEIHDEIVRLGLMKKETQLGSSLVDMYARCGALDKAQQVLDDLPVRDAVTWNTLITGYVHEGQWKEALKCLDNMQCKGYPPDAVTYTCALKACGNIGAAAKGEQIHQKIVNLGLLQNNIGLGNALVDMYARYGALTKAQQALRDLPVRDVISWNALIAGYAQQGQGKEALKLFDSMQYDCQCPNEVTFISALKACGSIKAAAKGEQIHDKIVSLGMLEKNIVLGNTLVDMYARCGELAKAQLVLEELPVRDVVTWNALITGYAKQGKGEEALKCFDGMQHDGHSPDAVTFTCTLKACGSIGTAAKGNLIHKKVVSLCMVEKNIVVGSTLVDMYAKCAAFAKAVEVFNKLPVQDVVTWNALIGGYALQGQSVEAVNCFERMQSKGVKPNSTTLICVLNSCSHSGLSDKAEMFFSAMNSKYGITPDSDHYCCMIDLFGRAGKFSKALNLIEEMSSDEYLPMWVALLAACRKWGEVKVARLAFEHALHLDKINSTIYICMACIYTAASMQEDADKIGMMRFTNNAWKMPECCWWNDATGKVYLSCV